jgi:hypothetical protein
MGKLRTTGADDAALIYPSRTPTINQGGKHEQVTHTERVANVPGHNLEKMFA